MLTRIRNAIQIKSEVVYIPKSNLTLSISKILFEEGFISSFEECNKVFVKNSLNSSFIRIVLKYKGFGHQNYITSFKRISKPGQRVFSGYKNFDDIITVLKYEQGTAIISTSIGVMSHLKATKLKKGGEILCYIG